MLLLAAFVWRCARVASPAFDLTLFRARNYRWANAATATFFVGFTASFFANIQFLDLGVELLACCGPGWP